MVIVVLFVLLVLTIAYLFTASSSEMISHDISSNKYTRYSRQLFGIYSCAFST